jgi:bifunctional non-homologous end joining protein LigD
MALTEYVHKRNFKSTPEPKGRQHTKKKKDQLMFVIHEHHASHLHYDFRLEWGGTLKSWAVPKGPSLDPHIKRLAVEVEDHPIEYGKFEGVIPEKQYGAGRVYIWDTGTWSPIGDAEAGLKQGRLEFEIQGKKLHGRWMLIRTRAKSSSKPQWLLMKRNDQYAVEGNVADVHDDEGRPAKAKKTQAVTAVKKKDFIPPALALLVDEPPHGREWVHETKYDGYRIQAVVQDSELKLYTRAGNDWADKFPSIAKALKEKHLEDVILDGEVVWLDAKGRSDFQFLQNAIKGDDQSRLFYYVFDILRLKGRDLTALPLKERKKLLEKVISPKGKGLIRYSEHSAKAGDDLLHAACHMNLEGLVSKKINSPYPTGRNGDWVKSKCVQQQEFVIGGFTTGTGSRVGFGALLLGVYEKGKLRYVGKVGTGFTNESLKDLKQRLAPMTQKENPFDESAGLPRKNVFWVRPELSAEIVFANWTEDRQLRVPVFHGLREDKPTKEIHEEVPVHVTEVEKKSQKKTSVRAKTKTPASRSASQFLKGLKLTHPDKILYEEEQLTKLDVARYYAEIGKWMIPFIQDRPLTLVRCPEGAQKSCFFQKHISGTVPEFIEAVEVQEKEKRNSYMSIHDPKGLISLIQVGAFEMHCWNSKNDQLENPDQIILDFDPDPVIPWKKVQDTAFAMKEILDSLDLKSFVKLSGGKGLHVHIPFQPLYSWDQVKDFASDLALRLEKTEPDLYLTKMSKVLRDKKIFIDYLRNTRGATAVAPYSLRAKEHSSVAMPLGWEDLKKISGPQAFSLEKALAYIQKRKVDPWKDYFTKPQKLPLESPASQTRKSKTA